MRGGGFIFLFSSSGSLLSMSLEGLEDGLSLYLYVNVCQYLFVVYGLCGEQWRSSWCIQSISTTVCVFEVLQQIIRLCLIVIFNFIADFHETCNNISCRISQIVDDETKILNVFPNTRAKMEETALYI